MNEAQKARKELLCSGYAFDDEIAEKMAVAVDKVQELELQLDEMTKTAQAKNDKWIETSRKLHDANRLNGEMLALIRKIDAFFENPRILTGPHAVVLDIPYEIAAGVKAVLTTPQKR